MYFIMYIYDFLTQNKYSDIRQNKKNVREKKKKN